MDHDDIDVNAREHAKAEKAEANRNLARRSAEDIQWLMSEERGRRIMADLLATAGVFRTSFHPENPHQTSFAEGERNVGQRYLALISTKFPDFYLLMLKEQATNG